MKVVHINKSDTDGGASVAARRIHTALRKAGVDSHMLVQTKKSDDPFVTAVSDGRLGHARNFINFVRERLDILPSERQASLRYNFSIASTGQDVSSHPLVRDADVIHLHWFNQGFLSLKNLRALARLGKPIVWTLHDMWPFTGGCHYAGFCLEFDEHCGFCQFLSNQSRNDLSAQVFKKKRDIYSGVNLTAVSCSQWLNSFASSGALFRHVKCCTIPNPIDTAVFRPLDKAQCRRQLGLPLDKKLLLFGAAKVDDVRKGYRYLDEALRIISDSFPLLSERIELLVFGRVKDQNFSPAFKSHQFDFVSDVDTLVKIYNAADVFVLPSLQDNLPNTVVESMACGTPVVGFRIGGVPEMIVHGRTGYLAEVKNCLSLANGIYSMLFFDNVNGRDAVCSHAASLFGEDTVAQQYIKVYQDAINRNSLNPSV